MKFSSKILKTASIGFVWLFLGWIQVGAQENNQIRGTLLDENLRPVPYSNALLVNPVDSSLLYGTVTDHVGAFVFSIHETGNLLLKVSFVGYEDILLPIQVLKGDNNLGNLTLRESKTTLNEVTVTAKRPLVTMKGGNIVTSVENSSLSILGTAQDIMRYIPGVIKLEDELQVSGKGKPDIYVDGHKLQDASELERISSDDIKSVELILNPGVRYDAQSRAVLEITTKKKKREGLSIYGLGRLDAGHYLRNREMVNVSYKQGKFDWFFNCSYFYSKQKRIGEEKQQKIARDTTVSQRKYSPNVEASKSYSLTGSFNYAINPHHFTGAKYFYAKSWNDWQAMDGSYETVMNNEALPILWTDNRSKANTGMHLLNAFYQGSFGEHFKMQFDVDYMKRDYTNVAWIEETENNIENHTDLLRDRRNKLIAGRLDFNYDLEKAGKLNWGGEYSHVETSGGSNLVGQVRNIFLNKEDKYALFLSYRVQLNKISAEGGLRYENVLAYASGNEKKLSDKRYSELYPSLSFLYPLRKVDLSLNFSKRVERPSFGQLSNELVYYNKYYWYFGNPTIEPEDIYDVEMGIRYRIFNFRLNYQYITDFIVNDYFIDPSNALVTIETPVNYPNYHILGATVTVEKNIGCWNGVLNGAFYKPFFKVESNGKYYQYDRPYTDISINNIFTLPKDYSLRLDGYFYSGGSRYNTNYKARGSIDMAVSKTFLQKALVLTLRAEDLFRWMNSRSYGERNGLFFDKYTKRDSRIASLTLTWKFNSQKSNYKGVGAARDEMNR